MSRWFPFTGFPFRGDVLCTNVLVAEMTYEQRRREGRYTNVLVAVITLNEQVRLHSSFADGGESQVHGQVEIGVLTTSNII